MKQITKGNEAIVKGRHSGWMPRLLRLPHHAGERDCGSRRALHAAGGRRVPAGRKRSGRRQHAVWRRCHGRARHVGLQRSGHQPDAGGYQLHRRRGAALRGRGYHARRAGSRQYRAGTGRLSPGGEGRRPRLLSHPGAGAEFRAGDGGPDHRSLRPGRPLSQSGVSSWRMVTSGR